MRYKVTKQYAKEQEKPLAEFEILQDAIIFLDAKSIIDEKNGTKRIYRIFDDLQLIKEINKEKIKIPINQANYAEGILHLPETFSIPFTVKQYNFDNEYSIAKFNNFVNAKIFTQAKIESTTDKSLVLLIFNFKQLIERVDQEILHSQQAQTEGSEGKEKKLAFRPTPFDRTLRLGPKKWLIEEDDEDDENKNAT